MIKILIATLIVVSANAGGLWDIVKNTNGEYTQSKQYTVEVSGTNIRAYVFDVPAMKSICVSAWGSDSSSQQLECKTYKEIGEK